MKKKAKEVYPVGLKRFSLEPDGCPGYYITEDRRIWSERFGRFFKTRSDRVKLRINKILKIVSLHRVYNKYFAPYPVGLARHSLENDGYPGLYVTIDGRLWSEKSLKFLKPHQTSRYGYPWRNPKTKRSETLDIVPYCLKYFGVELPMRCTTRSQHRKDIITGRFPNGVRLDVLGIAGSILLPDGGLYSVSHNKIRYPTLVSRSSVIRGYDVYCLTEDGKTKKMIAVPSDLLYKKVFGENAALPDCVRNDARVKKPKFHTEYNIILSRPFVPKTLAGTPIIPATTEEASMIDRVEGVSEDPSQVAFRNIIGIMMHYTVNLRGVYPIASANAVLRRLVQFAGDERVQEVHETFGSLKRITELWVNAGREQAIVDMDAATCQSEIEEFRHSETYKELVNTLDQYARQYHTVVPEKTSNSSITDVERGVWFEHGPKLMGDVYLMKSHLEKFDTESEFHKQFGIIQDAILEIVKLARQ